MGIFGALFITISLTLSNLALAVTPIIPVGLYAVEGRPDYLILAGIHPLENPLVVYEIHEGRMAKLPVLDQFRVVRDGMYDVRLQNGWRLVIPEQGKRNYVDFPFDASLVYPDRPRENLQARELTKQVAEQLGIVEKIDPEFFETPFPRALGVAPLFLTAPQTAQLLILSSPRGRNELSADEREKIKSIVAALPGRAQIAEGGTFSYPVCVIVDANVSQAARERFSKIADLSVQVFAPGFPPTEFMSFEASAETMQQSTLSLMARVAAARQAAQTIQAQAATPEELQALLHSAKLLLRELGVIYRSSYQIAADHQRTWVPFAATEAERTQGLAPILEQNMRNHAFQNLFLHPLQAAARAVLHLVHHLGTYEAREYLVDSLFELDGAGLSLAALPVGQGNYLNFWLGWLKDILLDADRRALPEADLNSRTWQIRNPRGSIYENLKLSGNNFFAYSTEAGKPGSRRLMEPLFDSAPLLVLGQNDDNARRAAKRAIIQFLIDADQIAERQLAFENQHFPYLLFAANFRDEAEKFGAPVSRVLKDFWATGMVSEEAWAELGTVPEAFAGQDRASVLEYLDRVKTWSLQEPPEKFQGNVLVSQFIHRLTVVYPTFEKFPGFSKDVYLRSAMDILTELLATSAHSVRLRATYQALLDTALGTVKSIRESSSAQPTLTQADKLERLVFGKLLNGITIMERYEEVAKGDCLSLILSPDPIQAIRKRLAEER